MRALVCHSLSPDQSGFVVEQNWHKQRPPEAFEVTLAIHATALNYPDLLMLRGGYQFRPNLPFIPGTEACGTVIRTGPGAEALLGQRVIITTRQGLLAERITISAAAVRPLPAGLSTAEAAAFTVGALTAWVGLIVRGRLKPFERVLVTGAGGGMGLAAVALAVHEGAHVTAVASTPERLALASLAGAHQSILIDRNNPIIEVSDINLVFDPVGGGLTMPSIRTLARGGRYAIIGFTAGQAPPFPLNRALLKELEIIGVRAGEHGRQDPRAGAYAIKSIDDRAAALRPNVTQFPLEDVKRAFAEMASGSLNGKAVIMMDDAV